MHKVKQAYDFTPFYGESCVFDNSNLSISASKNLIRTLCVCLRFFFYPFIRLGIQIQICFKADPNLTNASN
jgi:hypothetical protein